MLFKIADRLIETTHRYMNGPVCRNVLRTRHSKNCLVVYITKPFRSTLRLDYHQNVRQVVDIAKVLNLYDYNVDVVDYFSEKITLDIKYDMVIDLHPRCRPFYEESLAHSAIRISYITGSNPAYTNTMENARLSELEKRRGRRLENRRFVELFPKDVFERFDAMFFMGNEYNLRTYSGFDLPPVFFVPNTGYPSLFRDDFSSKDPRSFLFLSSGGQVLKGLDLLLEAFSLLPDLNLYVCSPFKAEPDFCAIYQKELYHSSNVFPLGFVDIWGRKFRQIVNKCSFLAMPSCSEGMAGSVLTGMSAGLIPIVSRECGFSDDDAIILKDCSISSIGATIEDLSNFSMDGIMEGAARAVSIVREKYNVEVYRAALKAGLSEVLGYKGRDDCEHI